MGLAVPQHVGPSQTQDQIRISCIGRQILDHWATREALPLFVKIKFEKHYSVPRSGMMPWMSFSGFHMTLDISHWQLSKWNHLQYLLHRISPWHFQAKTSMLVISYCPWALITLLRLLRLYCHHIYQLWTPGVLFILFPQSQSQTLIDCSH